MDYDHDRESFKISTFVVKNTEGINYFHPESKFIKSAEVYEKWPDILEFDNNGHIIRDSKLFIANEGRPFDSVMSLQSINNFIEDYQVEGLSHIMFDGKFVRDQTSKEIFNFEEEYPYLIKEYDSKELGLEYHVKIFKIDYEIFNNLKD